MASYKDLIFTKHAGERAQDRSISPDSIYQTIHFPDKIIKSENSAKKFCKTIGERRYQVVTNYLPQEKKWLVVSTWVRGEDDKVPFIWQLIVFPFKVFWLLIQTLWRLIAKIARKK